MNDNNKYVLTINQIYKFNKILQTISDCENGLF